MTDIDDQTKFVGEFHGQLRAGVKKRDVGLIVKAGYMLDGTEFLAFPERLQQELAADYAKAHLQASGALAG